MKLKIIKCSDPQMWYRDQIGKQFDIVGEHKEREFSYKKDKWMDITAFTVRDNEGYPNKVKGYDCRLMLEHVSHN